MSAFCPFKQQMCFERCALYSDGCLVSRALKAFVKLNEPIIYETSGEAYPGPDYWEGQMNISNQWGDR